MPSDSLRNTHKPIWQTETSGYTDTWGSSVASGAMELWTAIHAGLYYGNMSAWLHWYGSDFIDQATSAPKGKRYYALKQFFRFVRPGAVRVSATVSGSTNLFVTAYEHTAMNSFVVVGMNNSDGDITVNLTGTGVPAQFTQFQTTATDNCANKGLVPSTSVTVPAQSVVTLVSGNVYDKPVATIPESMGKAPSRAVMQTSAGIVYRLDGSVMRGSVRQRGTCVQVTNRLDGSVGARVVGATGR